MPFDPFSGLNASFRGMPFLVDDESGSGGRRGPLHEYPDRDLPFFEDMGRSADRFSLQAYFVGTAADLEAKAFEKVLRKAGSGLLIHPTRGRQTVVCRRWNRRTERRQGNWVEFALLFEEAGQNQYPAVGISWPHALLDAVIEARTAFADALGEALGLVDLTQEGAADLAERVFAVAELLNVVAQVASGQAPSVALASALSLASGYTGGLFDETGFGIDTVRLAVNTVGLLGDWADALAGPTPDRDSRMRAIEGLMTVYDEASGGPDYDLETLSEPERADQLRYAAYFTGIRRTVLAEVSRQVASVEFTSYDEAIALRERLADAFDAELGRLNGEDGARTALNDLQAVTLQAISERGADRARLVPYALPRQVPALVAAQLFYPDDPDLPGRARELATRNDTVAPAFLKPRGQRLSS
jgi:prophage DNA circulation protein